MQRPFALLTLLALSSLPCRASVSGKVTDLSGNGLAGVGIALTLAGTSTTTDATGAWSLATTGMDTRTITESQARWTGNGLLLILVEPAMVSVEAYDLRGAVQGRVGSVKLGAGPHNLPLALSGSGMVGLRVTVNGRPETILASAVVGIGHARSLQSARSLQRDVENQPAARSMGLVDTLRFTWNSRVVARIPLANLDTSGFVVKIGTDTSVAWNEFIAYGSLYDPRDGQVYRTVKIGSQTWMAENLNYKPIGADSGWCYINSKDSCVKYGRLYTWAEVMGLPDSCNARVCGNRVHSKLNGICPIGWHVPNDTEWTAMQWVVDSTGNTGGTKLKSLNGWNEFGNGTDVYGFRALPGGYFNGSSFDLVGIDGNWWSAMEDDGFHAWYWDMFCNSANVYRYYSGKTEGLSLRCSKD